MQSPSFSSLYDKYLAICRMSSSWRILCVLNTSWLIISLVSICVSHRDRRCTRFCIIHFTVVYFKISKNACPICLLISFFLLSVSSSIIFWILFGSTKFSGERLVPSNFLSDDKLFSWLYYETPINSLVLLETNTLYCPICWLYSFTELSGVSW